MDPKQNTQLDPKLQAVYDRVMGTDTTTPHDPTNPQISPTPSSTPPPADPGGIQLPGIGDTTTPLSQPVPINPTPSQTPPPVLPQTSPSQPDQTTLASTPIEPTPSAAPVAPVTEPVSPQTPPLTENSQAMEATQPLDQIVPTTQAQETVQVTTLPVGKEKKKAKISPVILILGGVVFLVVYALIWIKVFGLNLPFLPQ